MTPLLVHWHILASLSNVLLLRQSQIEDSDNIFRKRIQLLLVFRDVLLSKYKHITFRLTAFHFHPLCSKLTIFYMTGFVGLSKQPKTTCAFVIRQLHYISSTNLAGMICARDVCRTIWKRTEQVLHLLWRTCAGYLNWVDAQKDFLRTGEAAGTTLFTVL